MACFLLLVIAATVLTAPPGKHQTHAARTTSPEAFWRAALPDAPMPESIRELLRPRAVANAPNAYDDANVRDDDPPPPMNFNYDDYRSSPSPRHTAVPSAKALAHFARASSSPMVFFPEDAVRVGGSLPFPRAPAPNDDTAAAAQPSLELYTVRAVRSVEGSSFVLCRPDSDAAVYGCRGVAPASAYLVDVVGERGDAVTAAVVCRAATDTSSDDSNLEEHAAFRLLDVKAGSGAAVLCYAVPDAYLLLVKSEKVPSEV